MRKISKIQLLWMKIEAYFLEKKVNRDPQLRNAEPPPEVHEKILAEIHKRELQLEAAMKRIAESEARQK